MGETYYDLLRGIEGEDRAFAGVIHDAVDLLYVIEKYYVASRDGATSDSLDALASKAGSDIQMLNNKGFPKYEDIVVALTHYVPLGERYAVSSSILKRLEDAMGAIRKFAERKVA